MRLKSLLICAVSLYLVAANQVAAQRQNPCALPPNLREEISGKYPGAGVVGQADLDGYDRKLFRKDHGSRCPGLVKVDFYGDGKPTWALVLVGSGEASQQKAKLVVARRTREGWELRLVGTADASSPVVWRQGPGKYEGMSEP